MSMSKKEMRKAYELRSLVEQYYDIQKLRLQAWGRVNSWVKNNIGWKGVLKVIAEEQISDFDGEIPDVDDFDKAVELLEEKYNVVLRLPLKKYAWYSDQLVKGKMPAGEVENLVWITAELQNLEQAFEKKIERAVQDFQIYTDYLKYIRGISHTLGAGIIAWIYPIDQFKYSSHLRAYAGLTAQHYRLMCEEGHRIIATNVKEVCPVRVKKKGSRTEPKPCGANIKDVELVDAPPRKTAGYYTMINLKLKTHLRYRVVRQFEYLTPRRSFYRFLYDKIKQYYTAKDGDKLSKGHIRGRTMIRTASLFTSHVWEVWRKLEDLPVTDAYPIAKLGHTKIPPMTDEECPLPFVKTFKYGEAGWW